MTTLGMVGVIAIVGIIWSTWRMRRSKTYSVGILRELRKQSEGKGKDGGK